MTTEERSFKAKCSVANGRHNSKTLTKQQKFDKSSKAAKTAKLNGTHYFTNLSFEQKSEITMRGAKTALANGRHASQVMSKEDKSLIASKRYVKFGNAIIVHLESLCLDINETNFNANRHILHKNLISVPKYNAYLMHLAKLNQV